ncbi:MAG TPA: Smr/MutS family protein [Thermohalobaculum sp.]|nr:Smr/MutS family protein [Thermohalobaculum sp.]
MAEPPRQRRSRASRRAIAPEDRALWREVTRDANPLDPALRDPPETEEETSRSAAPPSAPDETAPAPQKSPAPPPTWPAAQRRLRPIGSGRPSAISIDLADRAVAPVGRPEAGLDRRNAERLRRGEREPDFRIDLHGMTAERAHRALDRAIGGALASGARLVLVITGKGGKRRDPDAAPFMRDDQGVLRQHVPGWLRSGPHARHIVGIFQAHLRHGGGGALYVYLKKQR